jgi:hypothetical protein
MGARARLRQTFNCSSLQTSTATIICTAMKKYGLILADVGSPWFLTGEASNAWSQLIPNIDRFVADMRSIKSTDMEIVTPPGLYIR